MALNKFHHPTNWEDIITWDKVIPFKITTKEEPTMEKNAEIKEGTTPPDCCGKPEACERDVCPDKKLEDHLTKRAADKASDCCKKCE